MTKLIKKLVISIIFFIVILGITTSLKYNNLLKIGDNKNSLNPIEYTNKLHVNLKNISKENYIDFLSKIYNIPFYYYLDVYI